MEKKKEELEFTELTIIDIQHHITDLERLRWDQGTVSNPSEIVTSVKRFQGIFGENSE